MLFVLRKRVEKLMERIIQVSNYKIMYTFCYIRKRVFCLSFNPGTEADIFFVIISFTFNGITV